MKDVKTLAGLSELNRDLEFYIAGEDAAHISAKVLISYKNRLQIICNEDVKGWTKMKEEQSLSEHEEKPH